MMIPRLRVVVRVIVRLTFGVFIAHSLEDPFVLILVHFELDRWRADATASLLGRAIDSLTTCNEDLLFPSIDLSVVGDPLQTQGSVHSLDHVGLRGVRLNLLV